MPEMLEMVCVKGVFIERDEAIYLVVMRCLLEISMGLGSLYRTPRMLFGRVNRPI